MKLSKKIKKKKNKQRMYLNNCVKYETAIMDKKWVCVKYETAIMDKNNCVK